MLTLCQRNLCNEYFIVTSSIFYKPCELLSTQFVFLFIRFLLMLCICMKVVRMVIIHPCRWHAHRPCAILSYSAEAVYIYKGGIYGSKSSIPLAHVLVIMRCWLIKGRPAWEAGYIIWYVYLIWYELVCLVPVQYIIYVSLHSTITC